MNPWRSWCDFTWPPCIGIWGNILCPTFNSNLESPIRKWSRKICEAKKIFSTGKDLLSQEMNVNPCYCKNPKTLTTQSTHNSPSSDILELWKPVRHRYSPRVFFVFCFSGIVLSMYGPCDLLTIFGIINNFIMIIIQQNEERERELFMIPLT